MLSALREQEQKSFDLVHLSNITDWLTPSEAQELLAEAHRVLRPSGAVFIRQLNSATNLVELETPLVWQPKLSNALLLRDRSFFYRALYVGVRRP